MPVVRVLSYNIRSMRDDRAALARVIQGCRPDVVCVQEAPRFWLWRRKRRRLARMCGLAVVAGRRPAGLAVLAGPRARRIHAEYHLLSKIPKLHRRGLAIAVLEIDGTRLIAASTHLDLAGEARRLHAEEVLEALDRVRRRFDAPVVLTGDINEEPGGPAWALLAERYSDGYEAAPSGMAHTYSAGNPRRRIDGVFADRELEILSCGVPADQALAAEFALATDHRPLLAELRLPG
jgi:endonuclease/exonuclease/phosphatase family metal-dependent hydrolase